MTEALSWGRYPRVSQQVAVAFWAHELPALLAGAGPLLPRGLGRSYGDSCLNEGGTLLDCSRVDRFIAFDAREGVLECEAGATLQDILRFALPRGFFLPVVPGTQFVTVGGAIANDIHGKNHHQAGTFGRHVRDFTLLRSDGSAHECSPHGDGRLFRATIGGLGLTGLVSRAALQLRRIRSAFMDVESIPFDDLEGFFRIERESTPSWEYTVAWVDCANRRTLGRGIFQRARHAEEDDGSLAGAAGGGARPIPFDFPDFALSAPVVRAFNKAYWKLHPRGLRRMRAEKFLFPLDALPHWNRIYGRRGFLQFQCVVPHEGAAVTVAGLLGAVAESGEGSFLSVLKTFGDVPSPGMLSFPRPGVTFALDFAMKGAATLALLERLEAIVIEARGAIYPAKDARMSPRAFRASFPRLDEFEPCLDPAFSSGFWRRVHAGPPHG
jgi:FAD/FMN-containing dehydrogenase